MADLDDVYNTKILEVAAAMPRTARLAAPDAKASARAKLCGSTISIDIVWDGQRITDYGQTVKACLLGQATASIVGREIVGTTESEFRQVARIMRKMLSDGGPPPDGRWSDLALLAPVKDYPHRHASTMLVLDALEKALDEVTSAAPKAASAVR